VRRAIGRAIALIQWQPQKTPEEFGQALPKVSADVTQAIVVAGARGYRPSATVPHKGFDIVPGVTAEGANSAVREIKCDEAIWPSAQEK